MDSSGRNRAARRDAGRGAAIAGQRGPPRDGEWSVRWDDHPEVEWSGRLRVEFRARLQGDSRASRAAVERVEGDAFDVGRRRIGIAGEIGGAVDFQIERELEDAGPVA